MFRNPLNYPPRHILLGIPTNIATSGPLGFRAEFDNGPKDDGLHTGRPHFQSVNQISLRFHLAPVDLLHSTNPKSAIICEGYSVGRLMQLGDHTLTFADVHTLSVATTDHRTLVEKYHTVTVMYTQTE